MAGDEESVDKSAAERNGQDTQAREAGSRGVAMYQRPRRTG